MNTEHNCKTLFVALGVRNEKDLGMEVLNTEVYINLRVIGKENGASVGRVVHANG